MSKRGDWLDITCEWCGEKSRKLQVNKTPPRFCNRSCSAKWRTRQPEARARSSKVMKKNWERIRAGELPDPHDTPGYREAARHRMLTQNPMKEPEIRQKVSAKLKAIGHRPRIRGGNGQGMTECEKIVSDLTGLHPAVVRVPKELRQQAPRPPTHYKLDLADVVRKLAIEIDGPSHNSPGRREQDRRKERVLSDLGWSMLRFTNAQVKRDPDAVALTIQTWCTTSK